MSVSTNEHGMKCAALASRDYVWCQLTVSDLNVFDSVASKYDLMNDGTSFGVHRLWKDAFVSQLRPGRKGPMKCIDVAGGTGDIALRILDYARENYYDRETSVDVVDINAQMLKEGFKRFKQTMYHNGE